jgi:hypothetical protein
MRRVAWLALLLLGMPLRGAAQTPRNMLNTQARSVPAPPVVAPRSAAGEALHWCIFNRPCNWSAHASIAMGVVWGLDRMHVRTEYAAAAAALLFLGKEVRDDRKWGHVLGTPDSMGDMLSGFAGAYVGYRLFRDRGGRRATLAITPTSASVTVKVPGL